jgi:hypothetical protein
MTLAEAIYQHSLRLPEPAAREALDFIEFLESRYAPGASTKAGLTPEQEAAHQRLRQTQLAWEGKPMTDRDSTNAR